LKERFAALDTDEIRVELLDKPSAARRFLERDRLYAAYALGSIEQESWSSCTALRASVEGRPRALYMLIQPAETVTTLLVMGEPRALEETFYHPAAGAPIAWINAKDEHLECLKRHWLLENPEPMLRMWATKESFAEPENNGNFDLRRLRPRDKEALQEAYDAAFGTPTAARLMHRGPYFGVWKRNRLISVAGTHFIAPDIGLTAIGNVWTRPRFRGKGLATLVVGAVTRELLADYEVVVLSVREDNAAAKAAYERVGYRTHGRFWQTRGRWKG